MCGRYTLTRSGRKLVETFELDEAPELAPRYNIAPTQESLVVRAPAAGRPRRGELAAWGFGGKGGRRLLINARAETAAEKPSFRDSFARRRCLVPADGFYEWRREGGASRPFYFAAADGGFFGFAGLWKRTLERDGAPGLVFTILTVEANERVGRVHPRMPLILPPDKWPSWLDERASGTVLADLQRPYPAAAMTSREVSTAVNSAAHDAPDCLAPPQPPGAVQMDLLT